MISKGISQPFGYPVTSTDRWSKADKKGNRWFKPKTTTVTLRSRSHCDTELKCHFPCSILFRRKTEWKMASRSFSCVLGVVLAEKVRSYICNVVKTISCNSQRLTISRLGPTPESTLQLWKQVMSRLVRQSGACLSLAQQKQKQKRLGFSYTSVRNFIVVLTIETEASLV